MEIGDTLEINRSCFYPDLGLMRVKPRDEASLERSFSKTNRIQQTALMVFKEVSPDEGM